MQLLALALSQDFDRRIVAADQAHELLRIHLVAVTTGILMRHRRATDIVRLAARLLRPVLT
jgi:hypothetical protein